MLRTRIKLFCYFRILGYWSTFSLNRSRREPRLPWLRSVWRCWLDRVRAPTRTDLPQPESSMWKLANADGTICTRRDPYFLEDLSFSTFEDTVELCWLDTLAESIKDADTEAMMVRHEQEKIVRWCLCEHGLFFENNQNLNAAFNKKIKTNDEQNQILTPNILQGKQKGLHVSDQL